MVLYTVNVYHEFTEIIAATNGVKYFVYKMLNLVTARGAVQFTILICQIFAVTTTVYVISW